MGDPGTDAGQVPKEGGVRGIQGEHCQQEAQACGGGQRELPPQAAERPGEAQRQSEAQQQGQEVEGQIKGQAFAPQSDVVDIAQGEQQSAHQQKGQQPGAQGGGAAPADPKRGGQIGPEEEFDMLPQALPHGGEQGGEGVGAEPVQGVQAYPGQQRQAENRDQLLFFIYHFISTPFRLGRRSVQPVPLYDGSVQVMRRA